MILRNILLALAFATPCIGDASVFISEDQGGPTFGSFTGTASQGPGMGMLLPRLSDTPQSVTQLGSDGNQSPPSQLISVITAPTILDWQVIAPPLPDVLPVGQDANAIIRFGGIAPSVIYPAITAPSPLLHQIAPVDFQIRLEPSPIPESATALLWAIGMVGISLASRRNAI
ncbi:MAG: hypothetical protein EKK47_13920 [Burkholderiales bacterium]|nr:MAG: hypothetical protein EKK47_13920 [Burkholderiales bacterium]